MLLKGGLIRARDRCRHQMSIPEVPARSETLLVGPCWYRTPMPQTTSGSLFVHQTVSMRYHFRMVQYRRVSELAEPAMLTQFADCTMYRKRALDELALEHTNNRNTIIITASVYLARLRSRYILYILK